MQPWISSKKLFTYTGLYFILIFVFNWVLSVTNINIFKNSDWWPITYTLALSVFLFLPLVVGRMSLFWLYKLKLANSSDPIWVRYPIAWCFGHILLNLVAILSSITKLDYKLWVIFLLIWLINFFCKFEITNLESKNQNNNQENNQELSIESPNNINNQANSVLKNIYNLKNLKYFWLVFFVVLNLVFFGWWYSRMEFVSFNTDNLQNAHLANIFKREKVYNPIAIEVSPQFTQVDYTTILTPNFALALEFFDFREVMYLMTWLELIISSIMLIVRYHFFRLLNLPKLTSAIIAFLISTITFSGLYMSGTYYNQQVLVFCLPVILYFLYKHRFFSAILFFFLLIPFHFTMSIFLFYTVGLFWFFWNLKKNTLFYRFMPFFSIGKYVFVFGLFLVLALAALNTFEINYLIVDKLLQFFASRPQYANTIGIYSNIAIIQIFIHAIGPLLTSLLLCMPVIWLFTNNPIAKWSFFIVSVQIAILAVPFPVAGRTFIFFSLPFGLALYFTLQKIVVKNYLINICLVMLIVSNFLWSVTVRTQDLDISGNYWSKAFLSREYMDFLILASDILESKQIKPSEYKVISEYFVKHHFEVMAYKYDDSGVYQEDKTERSLLFQFLNNTRSDSCEHYKVPYLVYILNERVYKWSRVSETLSKNSAFAIWWSNSTTRIESDYIFGLKPNSTGQVVTDKSLGQNRLLIVKC